MRRLSAGTWLALVFALIAVGLLAWLGMDLLGGPARVSYLVTVATPPEQMVTVEARLEHLPRRITTLRLGMNTRYAFVMPDSALLAGPPELTAADGRQLTLRQVGPFRRLPGGDVTGEDRARLVKAEKDGFTPGGGQERVGRGQEPGARVADHGLAAPDRQDAGGGVAKVPRDRRGIAAQPGGTVIRRARKGHRFRDPHGIPPVFWRCFTRLLECKSAAILPLRQHYQPMDVKFKLGAAIGGDLRRHRIESSHCQNRLG